MTPAKKFLYNIIRYIALDSIGHFSKTKLNLTHSHINPKFLLALWKYLADLFKKTWNFEKNTFRWSYVENKYMYPEDPTYIYLSEWADILTYDVIKNITPTSSYMKVST